MRAIERIDNFLEKVNWSELQKKWKVPVLEIDTEFIRKSWKDNPDQRIGQLLINLGLIDDSMEAWVSEESDILIDQGVSPEGCLYWTSIYDKDENVLPEPITRLVSELSINHINRIIEFIEINNGHVSYNMRIAFENMLERDKKTISINSATKLEEEVAEELSLAA